MKNSFKYNEADRGSCGRTFELTVSGEKSDSTFFVKTPSALSEGIGVLASPTETSRMIKDEYVVLATMNLLGLKTPTELALVTWADDQSMIFKRKVGEGQGEKGEIAKNHNKFDLDQIIRIAAVSHVLCAKDINVVGSTLKNAFNNQDNRRMIYDPILDINARYDNPDPWMGKKIGEKLSKNYPLSNLEDQTQCYVKNEKTFLGKTFEMSDQQSLFYFPFKSLSEIDLFEIRKKIDGHNKDVSPAGLTPTENLYPSEEIKDFFQKVANPQGNKEEKVRTLLALGKIVHNYKLNRDEIVELAKILTQEQVPLKPKSRMENIKLHDRGNIAEQFVERIDRFCSLVQTVAQQMDVDITYHPHTEIPNSYIARNVVPIINKESVSNILDNLRNSEHEDNLTKYLKERTDTPTIYYYDANHAAKYETTQSNSAVSALKKSSSQTALL